MPRNPADNPAAIYRDSLSRGSYWAVHHPLETIGEGCPGRVDDREVVEPGRTGRRRRASPALSGVEADVVVVAAGEEKDRLQPHALRDLEPEYVSIEPSARSRSATLRWTWPIRVSGWIGRVDHRLLARTSYRAARFP
jgi:hypothetical protein